MKKRNLFIGLTALVLIGGVSWYLLSGDAPSAPSLPERASGTTGVVSADGVWRVADGSFVGYRVAERFIGEIIDKDAVGRTSDVSGGFKVAGTEVSNIVIEADTTTIASNRVPRDTYLESNALETALFPTATFVVTDPIRLNAKPVLGQTIRLTLEGMLTLHGQTRLLAIPVEARWNGATIDIVGTAPITLADYGINTPSTPIVSASGTGSLEIQLILRSL